jgi:hypothetical protein
VSVANICLAGRVADCLHHALWDGPAHCRWLAAGGLAAPRPAHCARRRRETLRVQVESTSDFVKPQASIFGPARSTGSPTSIVLQLATSGFDRVKPQRARGRGQPSGAVPPATKAHHATIVEEAEIHRAGRATRANRSLIDGRKACGWRACPRAEKNERPVCSYFRICAPASCELCSCVGC